MKKSLLILSLFALNTLAIAGEPQTAGTVTDVCGNTYNYVKIGGQYWMAENLKCTTYDTKSERAGNTLNTSDIGTYAPIYIDGRDVVTDKSGNLSTEQRQKLGLLYNWAAAVGLANESESQAMTSTFSVPRQGICPNGWHLPTDAEYEALITHIETTEGKGEGTAGKQLKSTSGWYDDGNGADLYGFEALPAGHVTASAGSTIGMRTYYWTSTPINEDYAYEYYLRHDNDKLERYSLSKFEVRSIRCVRSPIIKFINYDGNELQSTEVAYGAMPVYTGATPTKPLDAEYTYTFTGWDNEIEPVTEDKTYTAVFKAVSNGTVSDICGNAYHYVKIGSQVWLAENMKCNKYDTESEQAGVTLPTSNSTTYAPYYTDGRNTTTSYSGNLTDAQREKLGFLYNWAAVVGLSSASEAKEQTTAFGGTRQGICPNGWHVPSETEWNELAETLGGSADSGKKLKTTSGWYDNGNGTDLYGFEALPAGYGNAYSVLNVGYGAYFWTATPYDEEFARNKYFNYTMDNLGSANISKWYVRSVRCVKTKYAEIIFLNDDGTELQISEVEYGATPVYTGATPYKPSDSEEYKYVFSGWDSEIIPATEDKVYTATFVKRPVYKNGVLNGEFSVGENKKVHFSQGNLQYNAALGTHQCADGSTQQGTWRFAENQWDYVGDATRGTVYENGIKSDNSLISSTYNGWIDLFGWGTSGWDSGANAFQPFSTSNNQADYYPGGDYNTDLQGLYAYSDWGVYNAIANGGDMPNLWYTLSDVEWKYLFNTRENAENLRGNATVNGIHCYLILPDLWSLPQGLTFTPGTNSWDKNVYSLVEWFQMEDAGAVLVSNALRRVGSTQFDPTIAYWSSSHSIDQPAKSALGIAKETTYEAGFNFSRSVGHSVRLVQRVKYEVKFVNYDSEELQSEELEYGETPVYKGSTPVKPADAQYTYTFNGWEPEITDVIGPQTYTAQFSSTTNKYTVRFLNDDGYVLQSENLDYGSTPEYKGATPTKPATAQYTYTFDGWDKAITSVTEATDYTATYSSVVNKYEIKFVNYDGEELQSEELEYGATPEYKGQTPVKPADAQYTYTFSGWEPEIAEVTEPKTYTAQFSSTTNKYTVRFLNDDGDALQSENLDYGSTPEYKGSEPTKPATAQYTYTFNGWDKTITTVTEATDYTATYSSTVNMYEIKFVNYNGDELQSEELEYGVTPVYKGQTPVKPADAQYTYTFSGWSPEIVEVTEAKTYTAQFSNTTNKYTIRFLNDNGEVLQSESLYYGATPEYKGSTPTKPTTAQYTYTFAGWDKTITTVTEATDYTATYNSVVNKYEIKFVNYDGEELQSEELDYGATPEYKGQTPAKPADAQYTYIFIGWSPEIAEVTEAKTYTAQFSSTTNKYTIRFLNDNGDVLQSESLDYGATPEYKGSTPTKPATAQYTYTFAGWDKTITTVTEATDYTATYNSVVNKYEIKFVNYDGTELQSEELEYGATPEYKGQTPVKPADAQYTYTFSGWSPEIAEVTEPKTYTAQFSSTTNKYTVKTIAQTEGVTTGDGLYDYGETATLTATPNEGYEFTGWSNGKTSATIEIVVTKDTTLTAYFQFKPCTVEKDIEVSVPEGGTITLKSGKTITVTKSQKIDDLKITPLKCDSLFHYNITMIRQSADNTPACDNAPSVAKYDWLFMINVKALNAQGYAFGEGNVSWYKIVGEMDNIDDPASMHTDQLVGKGYGYTIDKSFIGTGDYYALIDLPRQTSDVGCKGIMRTQVFRYVTSKRVAPAVIPTIARPSQRMQVMHLPQEENCEIYVYDNVGKLCRHFASHGADTAEFEAEMRQGSYIVVIKSADGTESVKYIVK